MVERIVNSSGWSAGIPSATGEEVLRTLSRTFSGKSRHDEEMERLDEDNSTDADSTKTKVDIWRLAHHVKEFQNNDPADSRKLGVTWNNLTVKVVPAEAHIQENFISQFNIFQQIKESRQKSGLRKILDSSSGCVKPGEMLLVLGR
ncbi:hypothetical protein IAQ61_011145 [Plenodomus lingam]|nr:hypothetical protein IAQ61_011145 [Plenodomus lingam]